MHDHHETDHHERPDESAARAWQELEDVWARAAGESDYLPLAGPRGPRRHVLRAEDWMGYDVRAVLVGPADGFHMLLGLEFVPEGEPFGGPELERELGERYGDALARLAAGEPTPAEAEPAGPADIHVLRLGRVPHPPR